jgi:cytochrome c-type biogenesis protein CcmF
MFFPIIVGLGTGLVSVILGATSFIPALAFGVCGMAAAGIAREWAKGTEVRHKKGESYPVAFTRLISSNRPRYGGYIAHIGIIMVAFAATGSSFYSVQDDFSMVPGDRAVLGEYEIKYLGKTKQIRSDRIEQRADVILYKNGELIKQLQPGYTFYPSFSMAATRAGIRQSPVEDVYILANEFSEDGRALFRLHINPLIIWLWLAGPVMVFGTVVALWPERQKAAVAISTLRDISPTL